MGYSPYGYNSKVRRATVNKESWTPDKVCAGILIVGCLALVASGIDGEVKSILTIAATYLFYTGYVAVRAKREKKDKDKEE